MRMTVARRLALAALGALLCCLCAAPAGAMCDLRIVRSRTYIMGYTVEGGFVLPVTGVLTDGIEWKTRIPKRPSRGGNRREMDRFFTALQNRGKSSQGAATSKQTAEPRKRTRKPGPRVTTLAGKLIRRDDGKLHFVVGKGDDRVDYALKSDSLARGLLEKAGVDEARVVLIGSVNPNEKPLTLLVRSGWLLDRFLSAEDSAAEDKPGNSEETESPRSPDAAEPGPPADEPSPATGKADDSPETHQPLETE